MAVKKLLLTYSEEEHRKLMEIKNKSGYNWEVFMRKAAESYDKFGEVPESYHKEML